MKRFFYIILAVFLFAACNKAAKEPAQDASSDGTDTPAIVNADGTLDDIGVQTIVRGDVDDLNNVEFSLKVSSNPKVTEYGIAYSTNLSDLKRKTAWRKKGDGVKNGVSSVKIDLLYTGATYYYAAYSVFEGSCYYGDVRSFKTPDAPVGKYVYLGLSVPWADRNIGAKSPVECGNRYYWADVNPAGATCDLYSHSTDDREWMDMSEISGTQYDAAKAAWGGNWRLPTRKEMEELALKCKWELVTVEGVQLFKVSSKSERLKDNYIYVPLTGVLYNGTDYEHDEFSPTIKHTDTAYLMTSTQVDHRTHDAMFGGGKDLRWCYALEYDTFDCADKSDPSVEELNHKYFGYCIRPVYIETIIN